MSTNHRFVSILQVLCALLAILLLLSACSFVPTADTPAVPTSAATPMPTPAPTATMATSATAIPTTDGSLQFSLDIGSMATGSHTETIPAVPAGNGGPYWEVLPEYIRITLQGYPISGHRMQPQIFIYPAEELGTVNEGAGTIVASMQTLLRSLQEIPDMPFLPLLNAAQVMHAHLQYLDFKNGQGLRYLTEFDQGIVPINNRELIYTYQGMTSDGEYYVAAVLPVNHPSLPADGTVTGHEPIKFASDYPAYLADVARTLNTQAASSFTPDLTQLDAMMSSLAINPRESAESQDQTTLHPSPTRSDAMPSKTLSVELPVSWTVDDIEISATLARPAGEGPFPAVIFVAGSGPTDRNWNTPLLPGTNGSGALLAQALTADGFITLRYDKAASGPNASENAGRMAGRFSMQSHVDELAGGVSLLAGRDDVNPAQIFVLTNSEGCVHALNHQTEGDGVPFAGMVLTSAFARSTGELARGQIAAQLLAVPGGDALVSAYDAAIAEFMAERPVPTNENLPEGLQQLIMGITHPGNQPFSRELWGYDPTVKLAEIEVPVLIVLGKKDIQVDWQSDGAAFEMVAKEHANVTISYLENANHVMKAEPKPRSELSPADVMATYSADEVTLDPVAVETIIDWLRAQS